MEPKPFNPPAPTIETVRDVRQLGTCHYCGRLGKNLPVIERKPGKRRTPIKEAHVYCIVTKGGGFEALVLLPREEIDKMRVADFVGLGLTLAEFEVTLEATRQAQPGGLT